MKDWIRNLKVKNPPELIKSLSNLSYMEQRKIQQIAFAILKQCIEKQTYQREEDSFTRKKIQGKTA